MRHARTQWMVMEGKQVTEACQQIIAHAEATDCKRTPVFHRPFFVLLNLVMYEAWSFLNFSPVNPLSYLPHSISSSTIQPFLSMPTSVALFLCKGGGQGGKIYLYSHSFLNPLAYSRKWTDNTWVNTCLRMCSCFSSPCILIFVTISIKLVPRDHFVTRPYQDHMFYSANTYF